MEGHLGKYQWTNKYMFTKLLHTASAFQPLVYVFRLNWFLKYAYVAYWRLLKVWSPKRSHPVVKFNLANLLKIMHWWKFTYNHEHIIKGITLSGLLRKQHSLYRLTRTLASNSISPNRITLKNAYGTYLKIQMPHEILTKRKVNLELQLTKSIANLTTQTAYSENKSSDPSNPWKALETNKSLVARW